MWDWKKKITVLKWWDAGDFTKLGLKLHVILKHVTRNKTP